MTCDEMSFLAVLIHCPNTLLQIVLCLLQLLVGSSHILAIPHTGKIIFEESVNSTRLSFHFLCCMTLVNILPFNSEHLVSVLVMSLPFNLQFFCHPSVHNMLILIPLQSFPFGRFLLLRESNGISFLPLASTESIPAILS
jgi:hypothetical protein